MSSQFVRGLGRGTLAKSFDDSLRDLIEQVVGQPETAQALELGDLGDDALQTDGAGVGLQLIGDRWPTLYCLSIGSVIGTACHD